MANITIRNIPDDIFKKIKTLSILEKRSINSEILVIIEKGLSQELRDYHKTKRSISKEAQLKIWKAIAGKWEDKRTTKEIIKDIYSKRSKGRKIIL